jgi:hypothetical protein
MYLDADLVAFFKAKAGGRGYQTLINETLRGHLHQAKFLKPGYSADSLTDSITGWPNK